MLKVYDFVYTGLCKRNYNCPINWHESDHQELRNLECRPFHGEIIVEAEK